VRVRYADPARYLFPIGDAWTALAGWIDMERIRAPPPREDDDYYSRCPRSNDRHKKGRSWTKKIAQLLAAMWTRQSRRGCRRSVLEIGYLGGSRLLRRFHFVGLRLAMTLLV
jgi:hypothetical protein